MQLGLRRGGSFEVSFMDSDGTEHTCSGVYADVQPETKLSFSWRWKSEPGVETFVSVLRSSGVAQAHRCVCGRRRKAIVTREFDKRSSRFSRDCKIPGAPSDLPPRVSDSLKSDWQKHVLASSGYLELGMFDDAAMVLEEIEPEDKTRTEVLGARVNLYMAAKKWDMAAAVASHLVKVDPENEAWWINLAYSVRRSEGIEQAEAILLRAQAIHPKIAIIAFNLACYASVTGRMEEAKQRLRLAIDLDKDVRRLAIDDEDLRPLWDWIGGLK